MPPENARPDWLSEPGEKLTYAQNPDFADFMAISAMLQLRNT
jgi:hypothetical protein